MSSSRRGARCEAMHAGVADQPADDRTPSRLPCLGPWLTSARETWTNHPHRAPPPLRRARTFRASGQQRLWRWPEKLSPDPWHCGSRDEPDRYTSPSRVARTDSPGRSNGRALGGMSSAGRLTDRRATPGSGIVTVSRKQRSLSTVLPDPSTLTIKGLSPFRLGLEVYAPACCRIIERPTFQTHGDTAPVRGLRRQPYRGCPNV